MKTFLSGMMVICGLILIFGGVDLIETSIDWFGLTIGFATSLMGILTAFCGGLLQTGRNE
jgi:uncharacterized membrane protein